MNQPTFLPTAAAIAQTEQAIAAHITAIDHHPARRTGAYPYYRFHAAGTPILGTVMLFHGFSASPHQLWRLTEYLFQNGFNVYQCSIAGHSYVNPAQNWPQVDLRPEIATPLKAKVQADPVLNHYLQNVASNSDGFVRPGYTQRIALMARLLAIEPRLLDMIKAIETPDDPAFDRYFLSSHLDYLHHAKDRLAELEAMPGPIYTVGLSAGGAVALALAAANPDRIQRVVAYAPLLRIHGEERRRYVNLSGPLDISESGWDPQLRFPVGCLTAVDRFGSSYVLSDPAVRSLKANASVFLVLTENEDAADIQTNQSFFEALGGRGGRHYHFLYPAADLVPHPMVDPTEVSQGMSNRFWQSLYQETYRFLTQNTVNLSNLNNLAQIPDLPQVPPVE